MGSLCIILKMIVTIFWRKLHHVIWSHMTYQDIPFFTVAWWVHREAVQHKPPCAQSGLPALQTVKATEGWVCWNALCRDKRPTQEGRASPWCPSHPRSGLYRWVIGVKWVEGWRYSWYIDVIMGRSAFNKLYLFIFLFLQKNVLVTCTFFR